MMHAGIHLSSEWHFDKGLLGFDSWVSNGQRWEWCISPWCFLCLCVEFWHSEPSFAKCVQAMGKNCNKRYIKGRVPCLCTLKCVRLSKRVLLRFQEKIYINSNSQEETKSARKGNKNIFYNKKKTKIYQNPKPLSTTIFLSKLRFSLLLCIKHKLF